MLALCSAVAARAEPAARSQVEILASALAEARAERQRVGGELARTGLERAALRRELQGRERWADVRVEALEWSLVRLGSELGGSAVVEPELPAAGPPAERVGGPRVAAPADTSAWPLGELLRRPRPAARPRVRATWRNWRVTGDVFAGARGDSSTRNRVETETSGADWGAALNLRGFAVDPRFLVFDLGADFQDVRDDLHRQETDFTLAGYRLQTHLLPERPWPLSLRLRGSQVDNLTAAEDRRFRFNTDYRDLGVSWQLRLPRRPQLSLSYDRASGSSLFSEQSVPSSENSNRTLAASVTHTWSDWTWTGGYLDTVTVLDLGSSGRTERRLDQARFTASTEIGDAGRLSMTGFHQRSRDLASEPDTPEDATGLTTRDTFLGMNLDSRHSPRLRGSYRFSWSENEFDRSVAAVESDRFSTRLAGARLNFDRTERLTLFWDTSAQSFANGAIASEFPDQLYTLGPGVAYRREVGKISLEGSYQPVWSYLTTTMNESATFWSHIVRLGAEAGSRERLRARAEYRFSDVQQVTRIGAFDRQSVLRLRLSSARFEPVVLRGHLTFSRIEVLNRGGRQELDDRSWALSADGKRVGLSLGSSSASGDGFVFAETADTGREITDPLPIDTLVPSPFLERESRRRYVRGRFNPRDNLRLTAAYETERSEFAAAPDLELERWELLLHYRLGRFTITGGYFREDYVIGREQIFRDRHYLRIVRSFSFFPFLAR